MIPKRNSGKAVRNNGLAVFRWAAAVAMVGTILMAAALAYWATLPSPEGRVHAPAQPTTQ